MLAVSPPDEENLRAYVRPQHLASVHLPQPEYSNRSEGDLPDGGLPESLNRDKGEYFLYFSTLNAYSRLAVKFLSELTKRIRGINIVVVGIAPQSFGVEFGSANLRILGYVPQNDFDRILSGSRGVLIPALARHGMATKLIRALGSAKPIVTTSAASSTVAGIVAGRDLLVGDDPNRFVEHVSAVESDGELRRSLGRNAARLYDERLSHRAYLRTMESYLNATIERRAGS
ncbi:MAG: glycosyltransferase [Thermoplasmata archaeon]